MATRIRGFYDPDDDELYDDYVEIPNYGTAVQINNNPQEEQEEEEYEDTVYFSINFKIWKFYITVLRIEK